MSLSLNSELKTYWISFPEDPHLPIGLGVTATSEEDAFHLIREQGFDKWYAGANKVQIESNITIGDLDQENVVPNIGPIQFRGVWYPVANIGYGAPQDAEYKPIKK